MLVPKSKNLKLSQITLGGEIVTEKILNSLSNSENSTCDYVSQFMSTILENSRNEKIPKKSKWDNISSGLPVILKT